ncbi:MAG TPA: hypothetical protein VHU19_00220 [Pyrinomonadaceae bacterium]|nr:hypothetical protein [Pyrinomonadaceae bacterium]
MIRLLALIGLSVESPCGTFVLTEYFDYLRRNPDDAPDTGFTGYNFRLAKLDSFGGDFRKAEMVRAFINFDEYRHRFGSGSPQEDSAQSRPRRPPRRRS